jgi:hypothetical protein
MGCDQVQESRPNSGARSDIDDWSCLVANVHQNQVMYYGVTGKLTHYPSNRSHRSIYVVADSVSHGGHPFGKNDE